MAPRKHVRGWVAAGCCVPLAVSLAACSSSTSDDAAPSTSVPTSAQVTVPAGQITRTAPGTALALGESAALPADAFAPAGPLALYTVTGIRAGNGIPDDTLKGGVGYFIYVTVTSLAAKPTPAPSVEAIAGTVDGKTAALTINPPGGLADCAKTDPPKTLKRGESYATCLIALADKGSQVHQALYWADTTGDAALNYKTTPVVWGTAPAPSSLAPTK